MSPPVPSEPTPPEPALRERRRRQTEREIADVALDLFERQGIDHTTVDQIAGGAGVSARTFFRYFATKEAAALVGHVELDEHVERMLEAISPERPLLAQLEDVWREVLGAFDDGRSAPGQLLLRVRRLMLAEPALRQAAVAVDARRTDELVARLTRALGRDDDLGTRIAVESSALVVRVALDRWADARETGRPVDLLETYAAACAHLHALA